MKNKIAAALLTGAMVCQLGMASFAESGDTAYEVLALPFRLVTGTVGAGIGGTIGSFEGIIDTEQKFADHTFAQVDENPLMLPVGLVGAAVAIPVGVLTGLPTGAVEGFKDGYHFWGVDE